MYRSLQLYLESIDSAKLTLPVSIVDRFNNCVAKNVIKSYDIDHNRLQITYFNGDTVEYPFKPSKHTQKTFKVIERGLRIKSGLKVLGEDLVEYYKKYSDYAKSLPKEEDLKHHLFQYARLLEMGFEDTTTPLMEKNGTIQLSYRDSHKTINGELEDIIFKIKVNGDIDRCFSKTDLNQRKFRVIEPIVDRKGYQKALLEVEKIVYSMIFINKGWFTPEVDAHLREYFIKHNIRHDNKNQ